VQANTTGLGLDINCTEQQLTSIIFDVEELQGSPGEAYDLLATSRHSLVHLTFRNFQLEGMNWKMSDAIGSLYLLRTLNLSGSDIGGADAAGFGLLSSSLRELPLLYKLDLSNTSMTCRGLSHLELSAFSALRSLTHLRLGRNQLGEHVGPGAFQSFSYLTKLRDLDINSCGIYMHGCSLLAIGLRSLTCMEVLDLSYNNIGRCYGADRAHRLVTCPIQELSSLVSLRSLDLQENGISDDEAEDDMAPALGHLEAHGTIVKW
jgi:Ran GTPase-activating protein (RanGAP) involved in mRNA processing and transport